MSTSFWMILGGILLLCTFIFTKTVSNDARNDYMLRDILSNSPDNSNMYEEQQERALNTQKPQYEETPQQTTVVNTKPSQYSTTMHADKSEDYHTNYGNSVAVKEPEHVQEESYYQKDRCMTTDKVGVNTEPTIKENNKTEKAEPVQKLPKRASKFLPSDDTAEEEYTVTEKPIAVKAVKPQTNGFMYYTKIFWRGITFTLGALACLYGLNMFLASAAMGADTLVATLWVLIGVILVK